MKHLTLLLAGALLFALPQSVHAAEQCTTSELDLMCQADEFLQGIRADGSKVCRKAETAVASSSGKMTTVAALDRSNYVGLAAHDPRLKNAAISSGKLKIVSGSASAVRFKERRYSTRGTFGRALEEVYHIESTLSCSPGLVMVSCSGGTPDGNSCVQTSGIGLLQASRTYDWDKDVRITCERN